MDYPKLPKLNISGLVIAIVLGVVVAVGLYQAQIRGLVPGVNLPRPGILETRTVVSEENAVISAVSNASPSVVAIGISQKNATIGTGFVVAGNGLIITNKHVVSDPGQYTVITKDGQKYDVRKIYRDPNMDLAIVQIDATNLKPLQFSDSSKLKVGQVAIAIGNALGRLTNTVTTGVVSGLGRNVTAGDAFLIQTDAAINPGNSGGPLLSSAGQVIGVNVATTEGAQNIGFAIPINSVKLIMDDFSAKGFISRPYLGIKYRFITQDVALLNKVSQGAYIQEVIPSGPADNAGVKSGDIITKINDKPVDTENTVSDIVSKSRIGQQLKLAVWREGQQISLTATISESPNQ